MSLFVDTSVWSLAFRRNGPHRTAEVVALLQAIESDQAVFTTGIVLQELLQGFSGPKAKDEILKRFMALPFLVPDRRDHVDAAEVRNRCRRTGIQIGTIDALLAQLCIRNNLVMLTADADFTRIAKRSTLRVWSS